MANITLYEFSSLPNAANDCIWPADVVTAVTAPATVTLASTTRAFIVCSDADCHAAINSATQATNAASAYTVPILSAIPNQFTISNATSQTVKFA